MEASGRSRQKSISIKQRIIEVVGTAIAIITLAVPMISISYFSSNSNKDAMLQNDYSLPTIKR